MVKEGIYRLIYSLEVMLSLIVYVYFGFLDVCRNKGGFIMNLIRILMFNLLEL